MCPPLRSFLSTWRVHGCVWIVRMCATARVLKLVTICAVPRWRIGRTWAWPLCGASLTGRIDSDSVAGERLYRTAKEARVLTPPRNSLPLAGRPKDGTAAHAEQNNALIRNSLILPIKLWPKLFRTDQSDRRKVPPVTPWIARQERESGTANYLSDA